MEEIRKPMHNRKRIILAVCIVALAAIAALVVGIVIWRHSGSPRGINVEIGDTYRFGGIDWLVLDVKNGQALLITKDIVEQRRYHSSWDSVTWETCELRAYLNGTGAFEGKGFIDRFSVEEKARIRTTDNANPNNQLYGTNGGKSTEDQVFLLSIEEAVKYFRDSGQLKNGNPNSAWYIIDECSKERVAKYDGNTWWWWLRSPGGVSIRAAHVSNGGSIDVGGYNVNRGELGIRPAIWLDL